MENNIQILQKSELLGKEITVYGSPDNPFFLAKDVAEWLELTNVADMVSRIDEVERSKFNLGRQGEGWFLTEDGLYEIFMQSRKPIAKVFKKGVKEILKSVRKTGGYLTSSENDTPETIMARAVLVAQETIKRKDERVKQLETEKAQIIEETKPCVIFTESVKISNTDILVRDLAKLITQNGTDIGEKRLYDWMVDNKFLIRNGRWSNSRNRYVNYYTPTQRAAEMDLFRVTERPVSNPGEAPFVTFTTYVTGKGQVYFVNKFLKQKDIALTLNT